MTSIPPTRPLQSTRTPRHNPEPMRGYFGIGVEGISKSFNVGNLFRSAHAFGASFVFTETASKPTRLMPSRICPSIRFQRWARWCCLKLARWWA